MPLEASASDDIAMSQLNMFLRFVGCLFYHARWLVQMTSFCEAEMRQPPKQSRREVISPTLFCCIHLLQ